MATEVSQLSTLDEIEAKAARNGVEEIRRPHWLLFHTIHNSRIHSPGSGPLSGRLSAEEVLELEPELRTVGGIFSGSTGVVDSHSLMLAYQGDAEEAGAFLAFNTPVLGGEAHGDQIVLETGGEMPTRLTCDIVINTAGLDAPALAQGLVGCSTPGRIPRGYFAKGNYYKLEGQATPFRHLVYPVPAPQTAGLGVHATVDIGGQCRFGPDVEWVNEGEEYHVDPARSESFYAAIRDYWPNLKDGSLVPDYAGIRPKLSGPGEAAADFQLLCPEMHGGPRGLFHLLGIESPGLTASLALAKYTRAAVLNRGL